jgi:predicted glutamine amidotransferase
MCVIVVAPTKDPDLPTLYKCQDKNPHGGGVAWAENGFVHFKKGITAEQMQDLVANKPFPHIFHFRIASVGKVIPALCHPFVVKRKHNADMDGVTNCPVFFHNGTIQDWKYMAQLAGVKYPEFASDSMVLARIVSMRGEGILNHISTGNRFVVLRPDGTVKTYGQFTRVGDCEYSNNYWNFTSHRPYGGATKYSGAQREWDIEDETPAAGDIQCPSCGRFNAEADGSGSFLCPDCFHFWSQESNGGETPCGPACTAAEAEPDEDVGEGYRRLLPAEILIGSDEVKAPDGWRRVHDQYLGNPAGAAQLIRRKKMLIEKSEAKPESQVDVGEGYVQLKDGDAVQTGDQWLGVRGIWSITVSPGHIVGQPPYPTTIYRRRVKSELPAIVAGDGYRLLEDGEQIIKGDEWRSDRHEGWSVTVAAGGKAGSIAGQYYRRKLSIRIPVTEEISMA